MSDLEQAIAKWRRQMLATGIKTPVPMEELENHLREEIERQRKQGLDAQQAFDFAIKRIGQPDVLQVEFNKAGGWTEAFQGKVIGIGCCAFAGLFSLLMTPRFLTIHELSRAERSWGLGALALTVLSLASLRFSHKYLPVIRNSRVRRVTGFACGLTGVVWILAFGSLLPNVIVPQVLGDGAFADGVRGSVLIGLKNIPTAGQGTVFLIGIAIMWAITLLAILGSIAYGLEEAARKQTTVTDY